MRRTASPSCTRACATSSTAAASAPACSRARITRSCSSCPSSSTDRASASGRCRSCSRRRPRRTTRSTTSSSSTAPSPAGPRAPSRTTARRRPTCPAPSSTARCRSRASATRASPSTRWTAPRRTPPPSGAASQPGTSCSVASSSLTSARAAPASFTRLTPRAWTRCASRPPRAPAAPSAEDGTGECGVLVVGIHADGREEGSPERARARRFGSPSPRDCRVSAPPRDCLWVCVRAQSIGTLFLLCLAELHSSV
mmetsp:Transcript_19169/g.61179  ORF Transcript_19169/g.61179 Transcript_19169/m.61179 type:complete len:254 (+) Transcript_19169:2078-2839(+)